MTERLPVHTDAIESRLYADTINHNFAKTTVLRLEKETGWFVADAGVIIDGFVPQFDQIYKSDTYFETASKLSGRVRKLRASTLVTAQSIQLPQEMTENSIDEFLSNKHRESYRTFGYVALLEPGIPLLNPIKTEISGFLETALTGRALAVVAIGHYLNTPEGVENSSLSTAMHKDIEQTYQAIQDRIPTMQELLKIVDKGRVDNSK